jgi:hypothetical protein
LFTIERQKQKNSLLKTSEKNMIAKILVFSTLCHDEYFKRAVDDENATQCKEERSRERKRANDIGQCLAIILNMRVLTQIKDASEHKFIFKPEAFVCKLFVFLSVCFLPPSVVCVRSMGKHLFYDAAPLCFLGLLI